MNETFSYGLGLNLLGFHDLIRVYCFLYNLDKLFVLFCCDFGIVGFGF